jgi:hypothetical protein
MIESIEHRSSTKERGMSSISHHVGDIVWFWHEEREEPEHGLIVQPGRNVSTLFFEGKVLQISNNRAFRSLDDCVQHTLRHDFNRWR